MLNWLFPYSVLIYEAWIIIRSGILAQDQLLMKAKTGKKLEKLKMRMHLLLVVEQPIQLLFKRVPKLGPYKGDV